MRVEIRNGDEETRVAGTLIGSDNRQWLVRALGFDLDLELAPMLVLFRYDDVPGVIGRVGTLFGEAGVNIANMTVSRTRRGDKALMVLTVDSMPPPELVRAVRAEGFDDARFVELGSGSSRLRRLRARVEPLHGRAHRRLHLLDDVGSRPPLSDDALDVVSPRGRG